MKGTNTPVPLPVAHGVIGASLVALTRYRSSLQADWKTLTLGALLAIIPDFDFFPIFFLNYSSEFHRSFTHSIVFGLALGFLASLTLCHDRLKWGVIYAAATLSHTFLDYLTTKNGGVEFLWPISIKRFKFGLFDYPDPWLSNSLPVSDTIVELFKFSFMEMVIFAPVFFMVLFFKFAEQRR